MDKSLGELDAIASAKGANFLRLAGVTGIWFIATLLCAAGVIWTDGSGIAFALSIFSLTVTALFGLATILYFPEMHQANRRASLPRVQAWIQAKNKAG